jgi:serine/threonine protein kinase
VRVAEKACQMSCARWTSKQGSNALVAASDTRKPLLAGTAQEAMAAAMVAAMGAAAAAALPPVCPPIEGVGRLQCVRKLGDGGFGHVWLAQRIETSESVAVKFVELGGRDQDHVTTVSDVEREVAVHQRLFGDGGVAPPVSCRLLLALAAHSIEAARAVLVLELFDGIELHDYVVRGGREGCCWAAIGLVWPRAGRVEETEARPIVQTLLEALAHMHAMGVAHLDLKPQNVLIHPPSGNLKLIDYGTAALFEPLVEGEPAPLFWPLVEEHGGTKSFQSPERIFEDYVEFGKDKEGFDGPAADVFSLGCLTCFLLRGKVPFDWKEAQDRSSSMALKRDTAEQAGEKTPWAGLLDPLMTLSARCKANDPFGEDEDDDDDDDDDEHPLPSIGAIDFVRLATRYLPHERPTAQTLAEHLWLITEVRVTREDGATSSAELQHVQLFSLEGMLGKLELD